MRQIKQICSTSGGRTSGYLALEMIEKFGKHNVDLISEEIAATLRVSKDEESGSCSESCEAMLCEPLPVDPEVLSKNEKGASLKPPIIHYHGTPIWEGGSRVLTHAVSGAGAFVSFARPDQIKQCFEIASSVAIDNGAFSAWKRGIVIDWNDYYTFVEQYYHNPKLQFFVIPDVIEGGELENDSLIDALPDHLRGKAAPVWHLHESIERLVKLCSEWPLVCFGSSGQYATIRTRVWHARMEEAFDAIYVKRNFKTKIHGLRMLDGRVLGNYPLSTADSTNLACNIPKTKIKYPELTRSVTDSGYIRGLSDKDVKESVLMHRCAVLKSAIESVKPPTPEAWSKKGKANDTIQSRAKTLPMSDKADKKTPIKKANQFTKPFLKWVGGKFLQLGDILPLLEGHQRLIEPFAGGGSVFLNAGFKTALINDNCADLINTYQQLKENAHDIITKAFRLFRHYNTRDGFLRIREKFNAGRYTPAERAAVFIYLNRHCFNGLIRYNKKGLFNVSFGDYDAPYFPLEEMENFIGCSEGMTFSCEDYSVVIEKAGAGDVVFCDPPYEPLPKKDGFTLYSNGTTFKMSDQIKLAEYALKAHQRGATIIITNSGADSIKALYEANGFEIREVSVKRSMSSTATSIPKAKDIIAVLN